MIIGLGETGLSYARFLAGRGEPFDVLEDRANPERVALLSSIDSRAKVSPVSGENLRSAEEIYLSPGVPRKLPALEAAAAAGVRFRGDVEMFGELARAPIAGITGTNGKSTVSDLVYHLAAAQQGDVHLAGNIGTPCLDVLDDEASLYVIELSSYQLELAADLHTRVACVLNLAPDHMDRYESEAEYFDTKLALYAGTERAIVNRALDLAVEAFSTFGLDEPREDNAFGVKLVNGERMLMQGEHPLLAIAELTLQGEHNVANVLSALAIGEALDLDMEAMLEVVKTYKGLSHRTQFVAEINGVTFINDSKATNPGAMAASVNGLGGKGNVHLIAGGQTKGLSLAEVARDISAHLRAVYVIGAEKKKVAAAFESSEVRMARNLEEAVALAFEHAAPGDVVLLAPGCASQDEFRDYRERGDVFTAAALALREGRSA